VDRYSRNDVLRILRISSRQLAGWEKAGLVAISETYSFKDLLQVSKLRELQSKRVRSAVIRDSVAAMKRVAGMSNPLLEAGAFSVGPRRMAFRHSGKAMDPTTGQFIMDFESREVMVSHVHLKVQPIRIDETPSELFAKAISLEENQESQREAIATYEQVLELDPNHAAAHINLGTLYYNRQEYTKAEQAYRKAIEVDARYALAYFDLGNVLDETGRLVEAVHSYCMAITIAPNYADAHYNLALAYERLQLPRRALRHWKKYVELDRIGAWANHARLQITRILKGEDLQVVWRRPPVATQQ
jgi:tetratricopeptide (TPR) repeat protein